MARLSPTHAGVGAVSLSKRYEQVGGTHTSQIQRARIVESGVQALGAHCPIRPTRERPGKRRVRSTPRATSPRRFVTKSGRCDCIGGENRNDHSRRFGADCDRSQAGASLTSSAAHCVLCRGSALRSQVLTSSTSSGEQRSSWLSGATSLIIFDTMRLLGPMSLNVYGWASANRMEESDPYHGRTRDPRPLDFPRGLADERTVITKHVHVRTSVPY